MLAMPADRGELFADIHLSGFVRKISALEKAQTGWEPLQSFAALQPHAGLKVPVRLVPGIR